MNILRLKLLFFMLLSALGLMFVPVGVIAAGCGFMFAGYAWRYLMVKVVTDESS